MCARRVTYLINIPIFTTLIKRFIKDYSVYFTMYTITGFEKLPRQTPEERADIQTAQQFCDECVCTVEDPCIYKVVTHRCPDNWWYR